MHIDAARFSSARPLLHHVLTGALPLLFALGGCSSGGPSSGPTTLTPTTPVTPVATSDAGTELANLDPGDAGPTETCGDGFDNNADGQIDEGCSCAAGASQPCHPDQAVAGVGACALGTQTCDAAGEFGLWAACDGAVSPVAELCDDMVDNDCDNQTDCADSDCAGVGTCPADGSGGGGGSTTPPECGPGGLGVVAERTGAGALERCGPGCLRLFVGRRDDNYLDPGKTFNQQCAIFEQIALARILVPSAVTSATLTSAKWDDRMHVVINNELVWKATNAGATVNPGGSTRSIDNSIFPPEGTGSCRGAELNANFDVSGVNLDVTRFFTAPDPINFKIRVSVRGEGEGHAAIVISYDPAAVDAATGANGGTPGGC